MALHWIHLLPVDRYFVRTSAFIDEIDQKIITLLYQPLIGAVAHSLYFALVSELEKDQYTSKVTTHKTLMTMTGLPLNQIYEERKKLEGIGLLNVYKKEQDETITYLYELQKPFSPLDFFKDDVLSVYLYNRVGKHRYLQLKERFTLDKLNKEEFKETTFSFSDVFTSLHHSEISAQQGELSSSIAISDDNDIVNNHQHSYKMLVDSFDFSLLKASLSSFINPEQLFTNEVKDTIVRLAFVYRMEPLAMSKVIQDSLLQDDTIDIDILREKVKSWYRFTNNSEPPALGLRTHPEPFRTMLGKTPTNEEEEMILHFETVSPITLLENRSEGAKIPLADVKIVESLLLDYKLLPGVANVLIDFVLRMSNMKLPKPLVEKIAGQWARKSVKTVKEAMELAKAEYKERSQWHQNSTDAVTKEKPRKRSSNSYVKKDRLPKWLTEENKANGELKREKDDDIEKLKQELENKIKNYKLQKEG